MLYVLYIAHPIQIMRNTNMFKAILQGLEISWRIKNGFQHIQAKGAGEISATNMSHVSGPGNAQTLEISKSSCCEPIMDDHTPSIQKITKNGKSDAKKIINPKLKYLPKMWRTKTWNH